MTLEQTRQLGIEFERRVQTMIPETEFAEKLDTETIYSYINQFQDKYIQDLYKVADQLQSGSNVSNKVEHILQTLVDTYTQEIVLDDISTGVYSVKLPTNFGLYIGSQTHVSDIFKREGLAKKNKVVNNTLVQQNVFQKMKNTANDDMRIMRNPIVSLSMTDSDKSIWVIKDNYTVPTSMTITYYKIPQHMDLMTSTPCELPMDVFEDLVSGAVDLYVQYAAGADARKRRLAQQQNNNTNNENDERS